MNENKEKFRLNTEEAHKGFLSKAFAQALKMQKRDWLSLFLLGVSFMPGKIWKLFDHHLWVVSEYESLARDNGYWFYKYIRDNYPEKKVFYPISDKAADAHKIDELGKKNRIRFSSFKHYLLFWAAEKQFTSSKNAGFPSRICEDLVQWNFHRFQYVMLNHGITKGKSTVVDAEKTNFDYICTCSDLDREIIIKDNNQPENKVKAVGFARHDNLGNEIYDSKMILIMPTWRTWLNYRIAKNESELQQYVDDFLKSDYFLKYSSLLSNEELNNLAEENGYKIYFYLHDYAQFYSKYFITNRDNIVIAHSAEYDIQKLLKQAAILVTDYSSVCYDFAYMYKPVLYYQFDLKDFEYFQYKAGDRYSYEKDGVGEIFYDEKELVDALSWYSHHEFSMRKDYVHRVNQYFTHHDKNNCKRIYEAFCK